MATARIEMLVSLHRGGRLDEAEAGYRECLRDGETAAALPLGALLLQQARYTEAADLLEPLITSMPDNPDLAANLSVALRHTERAEEALQLAQRACAIAPGHVSGWNALGLAALELNRLDEALRAFDACLRTVPGHIVIELHRAHCLRRLGRNDEALPAYARVMRASPSLLDGWRGLAAVQAALGEAESALYSRQRALQLAPQDREVAFEYAVALVHVGQAEQAAQRFTALLNVDADDAQYWAWLGRARLRQGDLARARVAFERAQAIDPADPVIAHFHAASIGAPSPVVESDYIRRLFDDFADRFERTLVKQLAYDTPARVADFLQERGAGTAQRVLDLGCGTGLMGVKLAGAGRVIDGVDLSPRMLAHARSKGIYRELHAAELVEFLCDASSQWDLIVAADVFVYLAELRPIHAAVLERLVPGGWFAFSVERSALDDTELMPVTGRYRHAPERIEAEMREAGFVDISRESRVLRLESGEPVAGELLIGRRPEAEIV